MSNVTKGIIVLIITLGVILITRIIVTGIIVNGGC